MNNIIFDRPTVFTPLTLEQITLQLEDAKDELCTAQAAYVEANYTLARIKNQYGVARAKLVVDGVEGKNAEQREAMVRLNLSGWHDRMLEAEKAVADARLEVDCTRLTWDGLRYWLKAFGIAGQLATVEVRA